MSEASDHGVAVIIAAYDAAATITAAVRTALLQSGVCEVAVVDDCSNDDTVEIARQADDGSGRLRIHRLAKNCGPGAARNLGIENTTSPWITVLDADDRMAPGRISAMLLVAREADFIADELIRTSPEGRTLMAPGFWCASGQRRQLDLAAFVRGNLAGADPSKLDMGFLKPLVRRAFLTHHRLRYDEEMRLGEDYDLYARALALKARFLLLPALGYISVERTASLSKLHRGIDLERLRNSDFRLANAFALTPVERRALRAHVESVNKRLQWVKLIEAIKRKRPLSCLKPFCVSPGVSLHLAQKLSVEAVARMSAPFTRSPNMS